MTRKAERIYEDVKVIKTALDRLSLPTLAQLNRIDKYQADDVSGGGSGPKPKNSISDPTGNRVAARRTPDPVGDACKSIDRRIFAIAKEMQTLVQQLDFVLNPRDRHRETQVIHCAACEREVAGTANDRLRSGYCYQCYRKWLKEGQPSRVLFERQQRESTE